MAAQRATLALRWMMGLTESAPGHCQETVASLPLGARCKRDVVRMAKIKGELRGCCVAGVRIDFQAAQDDFLQPRWHSRAAHARGDGVAPKPSAPVFRELRLAKWPFACRQEVHNYPKRKQVITPSANRSLRGSVRSPSTCSGAI